MKNKLVEKNYYSTDKLCNNTKNSKKTALKIFNVLYEDHKETGSYKVECDSDEILIDIESRTV